MVGPFAGSSFKLTIPSAILDWSGQGSADTGGTHRKGTHRRGDIRRRRSALSESLGVASRRLPALFWRRHLLDSILLPIDRLPASIAIGKDIGEDCSIHILRMFVA